MSDQFPLKSDLPEDRIELFADKLKQRFINDHKAEYRVISNDEAAVFSNITIESIREFLDRLDQNARDVLIGYILGEISPESLAARYNLQSISYVSIKLKRIVTRARLYLIGVGNKDSFVELINDAFQPNNQKAENMKLVAEFWAKVQELSGDAMPEALLEKVSAFFQNSLTRKSMGLTRVSNLLSDRGYSDLLNIVGNVVDTHASEIHELYFEMSKLLTKRIARDISLLTSKGICLALITGWGELNEKFSYGEFPFVNPNEPEDEC